MSPALTLFRWSCLGIASLLLALAAPASPASAQAAKAEPKTTEVVRTDDEDELLEPSNTGYVDGAIVRTQIRIRYDLALDGNRPDRAEFIYGKCSCFTAVAGQDSASPGPAADLDYQEIELSLERAFSRRFSLFVELPFRSLDLTLPPGFAAILRLPGQRVSESGLGDLRLGIKYALIAQRDRYLTFQVRGYLPTGDAGQNLGTDHASIEPALLHFGRLSDRWTVSSELRWWHPLSGSSDPITNASRPDISPVGRIEVPNPGIRDPVTNRPIGPDPPVSNNDFAGDVLRFGVGASYDGWGSRVRVSPVIELVGWYVLDGYGTPPEPRPGVGFVEEVDGDTIVNLKLGVRIGSFRSGSIYVGHGVALTDDIWYDNIVRIEYRLTF